MLLELAFFLEGFAEFEEEQGFRFWINFKNNKPFVNYVPMEILKITAEDLKRYANEVER